MKHINAYVYYAMSAYVREAIGFVVPDTPVSKTTVKAFVDAKTVLKEFQENENQAFFSSSMAAASSLIATLQTIGDAVFRKERQRQLFTMEDLSAANQALSHFESMLSKDLVDLPLFCVEEDNKGNLSLPKLIIGASDGYPQTTIKKLTKAICNEIDESGRCLAFNRPTAAAFHILRALELTTQTYINAHALPMPPQNRCNWGEYIAVLRAGSAPKEITDLLQIIKDNYRNPIMHPELVLEMEEAVNLFGISQSAIEILCR